MLNLDAQRFYAICTLLGIILVFLLLVALYVLL